MLTNPYTAIIAATVATVAAVKKLCKQYEQLEQQTQRASRAFRMSGRMSGVGSQGYEQKAANIAQEGNYTQEDVMGGIASARQNAWSLDTKTFDKSIELAKDAAAVMGGDYSDALQKVTGLLHAETVSMEDLAAAGVILTRNEAMQLQAMQGYYKAAERQKFITEKMTQAYQGAEKEQTKTLSGMYKQTTNLLKDMMVSLERF